MQKRVYKAWGGSKSAIEKNGTAKIIIFSHATPYFCHMFTPDRKGQNSSVTEVGEEAVFFSAQIPENWGGVGGGGKGPLSPPPHTHTFILASSNN